MKNTKLFLIFCLFSITPNLLNCMEWADGVDDALVNDVESGMKELLLHVPTKKCLSLHKNATYLEEHKKEVKKQLKQGKIEVLDLQGIDPTAIPDYLLELLLNKTAKKYSLNCIDISPTQTRGTDSETGKNVIEIIKKVTEKVGELIESKVKKELKKITITVDQAQIDEISEKKFLKLPIQIDKKEIAKYAQDPNISTIKVGKFTIYIIPEECKEGWNVAGKVFAVLGYAMTIGLGIYELYTKFGPGGDSNNPSNSTDTTAPAEMFGGF